MTKQKFNAILSKNEIVREIRNHAYYMEELNISYILSNLKDIEQYLGKNGDDNQPGVDEIMNDEACLI